MFRIIVGVISFWLVLPAAADTVYKWVDEAGGIHYSDQPPSQEYEFEELMLGSTPSGDDIRKSQEKLTKIQNKQQTSQDRRLAV